MCAKALLLVANGGIEISDGRHPFFEGQNFDLPKAQALGGILNGRESEVQYELLRDHPLGGLHRKPRRQAGQLHDADRYRDSERSVTRNRGCRNLQSSTVGKLW